MKSRPILFNGAMVRAILDGRKTQTRRILKGVPGDVDDLRVEECHPTRIDRYGEAYPGTPVLGATTRDGEWMQACPFGEVGDEMWVRETHSWNDPDYEEQDRADAIGRPRDAFGRWCWYRATDGEIDGPWRPSIHMPRWASRITLRITDVRVERLQSISEADAIAEGVEHRGLPQIAFANFWESINGAGSWDVNPWVWAISFERVSP